MAPIKVFLVDDHRMFREGIQFIFERLEGFEIIGEASDGVEFLEKIANNVPDVVLMDISMPRMSGIEATKKAIDKYPDLKVMALSMFGDEEYYYKMIEAGAKGFILKESSKNELTKAICEIVNGGSFFSQELLRRIISNFTHVLPSAAGRSGINVELSKRELEVLELVCGGFTNNEIAEKLFLSTKTVEGHKSKILSKTGTRNTASLVMYAINNHYITI